MNYQISEDDLTRLEGVHSQLGLMMALLIDSTDRREISVPPLGLFVMFEELSKTMQEVIESTKGRVVRAVPGDETFQPGLCVGAKGHVT